MQRAIRVFVCTMLVIGAQVPQASAADWLEQAFAADSGASGARDPAKAAEFYRLAAEEGDAFASLQLGYLHETGSGVPQDYAAARRYYEEAVARGLDDARVRLALCHLEGWGGPQDRSAFIAELEIAASAGSVEARKILGNAYWIGIGTPVDLTRAARWFEEAAKGDDASAQHAAGVLAETARHRTLELNRETARTWYQLSAEQEYLTAMRAMARSLFEENQSAPQWETIERWLEMAIELGDAEAPFTLACLAIAPGRGKHDPDKAKRCIELAAARGNFRALEVKELVDAGKEVRAAIIYVMSQPVEERYAERTRNWAGDGPNRAPYATKIVSPRYPATARVAGIEGTVVVQFIIDTTGRVQNATALKDPHPLLTERAITALKQWRFAPGRKDGRHVMTRAQLEFPFYLSDEDVADLDSLLRDAYTEAERLGPDVLRDAHDLRLARPLTRLQIPDQSKGADGPSNVVLLLVLDEKGKPVRGHILNAEPKGSGGAFLQIALQAIYAPRFEDGKPVASNVVLVYAKRPAR